MLRRQQCTGNIVHDMLYRKNCCTGKYCTGNIVQEKVEQEMMYRKYCIGNCCTGKLVQESTVRTVVYRKMLYMKCCTEDVVQKVLYTKGCAGKYCTAYCTGKCHTGNVVQENVVQEIMYRR